MVFSVVLFDDYALRDHLLPLVATRPVGNLRVGVLTINQKWELLFHTQVSFLTPTYLSSKYPLCIAEGKILLIINSAVLPTFELVEQLFTLRTNQALFDQNGNWIAVMSSSINDFYVNHLCNYDQVQFEGEIVRVIYPEDVFINNSIQIGFDLKIMKLDNFDFKNDTSNTYVGDEIFIQQNVKMSNAILDSSKGPIYIGQNTIIESNVVIHGPAAIGEGCRLKTGTLLYPNVTVGHSTVLCGELNNTVIWGNTAKGHAGYLGHTIIGEGCNLGAGTTNSNLKNDWSTVKLFDYLTYTYRDTMLEKCGVVIGDHTMLGIESKINTGTVIGVGAQVTMSKFIPKFVPDFSWYTDEKYDTYIFERFKNMMIRKALLKNEKLTNDDMLVLEHVYHTRRNKKNNQH